jgi:hypothetical protein
MDTVSIDKGSTLLVFDHVTNIVVIVIRVHFNNVLAIANLFKSIE